jgi:hypothetical protein
VTKYHRHGNPLFVPEANRAGDATAPANAFYVFGAHDAIGFSRFGIESIAQPNGSTRAELCAARTAFVTHSGASGRGTMAGVRPSVSFTGEVQIRRKP